MRISVASIWIIYITRLGSPVEIIHTQDHVRLASRFDIWDNSCPTRGPGVIPEMTVLDLINGTVCAESADPFVSKLNSSTRVRHRVVMNNNRAPAQVHSAISLITIKSVIVYFQHWLPATATEVAMAVDKK